MYFLESSCQIQVRAQAGGALVEIDPNIINNMSDVLEKATAGLGAQLAWPALMRKVERLDPSYAT
jgi:hypothetical protein|nr:class II aldolase [Betaproteobacteria bacterium]